MEDSELTLECPHETKLEVYEGDLLHEFILKKVEAQVQAGKTSWATDELTGETFNFTDFEEQSRRVACSLYKRGMRKGDTAVYMTTHMLKLHAFFVGVWRANGCVRSSYPEDLMETLEYRVEESRAGWILCDPDTAGICLEVAEKMYWDVEVICTGEYEGCTSFQELFEDEGTELPEAEVSGDDAALILCTSGTTGRSKGAVHSHRSVVYSIMATQLMPFTDHKPNLLVTKGTHITGSIFPLTCLCTGKECIFITAVTKTNIFEAVDRYKPGLIWGFPTFLLLLVNDPEAANYDFSSLEIAATGGAQITPAMEKTMTKLTNCEALINCYGLTEVVPICGEMDFDDSDNAKIRDVPPFSVGKVCPGVIVQIRNPETGKILGVNERGEICAKSEAMFTHYLNNPQATQEAFIDGWFRTGDLGYYDENEFVFLVDRIKEIFKYWNNHISPSEVEDVINQHEAVGEVCVVGVEDSDGGGHVPRAYVTLIDSESTAQEIIQFANGT